MRELMIREREILVQVAHRATAFGFLLAIEIFQPTSYGVVPDLLALQVNRLDHPAIGVCLDTGHLGLLLLISINQWQATRDPSGNPSSRWTYSIIFETEYLSELARLERPASTAPLQALLDWLHHGNPLNLYDSS